MKAAIYARVSSEQQEERRTIESQVAELRESAKRDRVTIVEEYRDDGVSGATLQRPALDRLRDDAARGRFERLYVHSPDRLARKYLYQALVLEELARYRIDVAFLNKKVGDAPEDQLLLGIEGLVAEYERAKITERSRRGRLYRASQGELMSANVPFGYDYVPATKGRPAHCRINEPAAAVVRLIFRLYLKHGSSSRVALELHQRGIPSPTGREWWSYTMVGRVVRNESYAGTSYYNKTQGKGAQRPRSEWIPISVPAIVDRSTYEAAQPLLDAHGGGRRTRVYPLSGLLRCSACGSRYAGSRSSGTRCYYRCTSGRGGYPSGPVCASRLVEADRIEAAVVGALMNALLDPRLILERAREGLEATLARRRDSHRERSRLEREIERAQAKAARLLDLYIEGGIEKDRYQERTSALDLALDELRTRLASLGEQAKPFDEFEVRRTIKRTARDAQRHLRSWTPTELQRFLQALVEEAVYDRDRDEVEIRARIPIDGDGGTGPQSLDPSPGVLSPGDGCNVRFDLHLALRRRA